MNKVSAGVQMNYCFQINGLFWPMLRVVKLQEEADNLNKRNRKYETIPDQNTRNNGVYIVSGTQSKRPLSWPHYLG